MEETTKSIGRNEPCPCGSGKKYKRCHGVGAAPKVTPPKTSNPVTPGAGAMPGGFDPSQMDPAVLMQFTQALQRLPKGQMQRLQAIMQKAMSGRDVSREAEEFEKTLPVEFQELMHSFKGMTGAAPAVESAAPATSAESDEDLSAEEARKIVAQAAAEGKISDEEAKELLKNTPETQGSSKLSKFWKSIKGK